MVAKPSVWDLIGPGPCTRRVGDNKKNLGEAVCLHRLRNGRRKSTRSFAWLATTREGVFL